MIRYALFSLAIAGFACTPPISQKAASGPDHRAKGAKPIKLKKGRGSARDIATYPGGDRVDWKVVELPKGKAGVLRIRMRQKPARPGLALAFNVYDEFYRRVARTRTNKRRTKKARVKNAAGKYYIQVYAPKRMDAAEYKLDIRFSEQKGLSARVRGIVADLQDPPTLPAVIEPVVLSPEQAAAKQEADRVAQEEKDRLDQEEKDRMAALPQPITGRIIRLQRGSRGVFVTVSHPKDHGVKTGWRAQLLDGRGNPVPGGAFKVKRAKPAVGVVKLPIDKVRRYKSVRLSPP